jgi:hypothetical protein
MVLGGFVTNIQGNDELIAEVEHEAGLTPGLLASLIALENQFPDLNARGVRQDILRRVAEILDPAADRMDASR